MHPSSPDTTPTAPAWRAPLLIGGVLAMAILAGLLFALVLSRDPVTGSAGPSSSEVPNATPEPSVAPSMEPSQAPVPTAAPSAPSDPAEDPESPYRDPVVAAPDGVLPPGGVVRVTADALRVREQPFLDAPERTVVDRGELLVVGPTAYFPAFGPAHEDGYTWYPVVVLGLDELPAPGGDPLADVSRGWVAIGDGESDWVELLGARCTDDEPTLQLLSSLTEWERLACYGDRQLTFEGVLGCGGCGGLLPGSFTPEWLASPMNYDLISVEPQERIGPMTLHWAPDGPERPSTPGVAPILSVTGHFDDPAAAECTHTWMTGVTGAEEMTEGDPAISQLYCRSNFVVDSYEIIGEDEDFPFG